MIFGFFRTSEVVAFADSAAAEYARLQRSSTVRHDTADKRQQRFDKLTQKIDDYCREHKLNFYKKSKLLFALKQGLVDKGIAQTEIDELLDKLLVKGLRR